MTVPLKERSRRRVPESRLHMFRRSPIPLYIQVATLLRNRITDGHLGAGQKMPTQEELEEEFGVARVTVRQAVELLEKEGLVHRQQGRGTFVTTHMPERRWLHLTIDIDSLALSISGHIPRFLTVKNPPPLPRLFPEDGRAAAAYQYLLSVQFRAGEPFAVASVHVERSIFERSPEEFRSQTALPLLLELERDNIDHAQLTVVVGSANPDTSERLRMPLNSPTAEARYVVRNQQGVVTYVAEVIYRGDCVRFDIDLLRNGAGRDGGVTK
jgi:GntR family transcriptional regulator